MSVMPSLAKEARLLIVEDDADLADAMGDLLVAQGYRCDVATGGAAALVALAEHPFDLVISDIAMDGMSGIDLLDRTKRSARPLPFIFVSGVADASVLADARRHGAYRCLRKPYEARELYGLVERALFERERARALAQRRGPAELPLAGTMADLDDRIERMAMSTAPALILGETGTGKELVARAIHAKSDRRDRPFVAVNASAIPDQLLESELFGHVRGAFTGAAQARNGLLLEADGGTLLLDEIGDMPLALQSKLLRVVQFGEIRPVGGDRTRRVDVRIIAATHRDLAAMVRDGRFRADLHFRLSVLPLAIKPLRERPGDVAPLAAAFLDRARERSPSSPLRGFEPGALSLLERAPWPGNVRELESVIERLVVMATRELASREDLAFLDAAPAPEAPPFVPLQRWVADYVARVLDHAGGNKARAAEILGVDPSTIYRWQRKVASA